MNIDVVITWVDGNDPVLNAKRASYAQKDNVSPIDDVAGATRYANRGEIHWCIHSINKFMPWVNRIFIVTDGQDPMVESKIPVEIIDHRTIFRGFGQYLPTFNSLSIEAMLWRIPGLNEHFVYFNDDLLICRDINPDVFFPREGHINCHGHKASLLWTETRYFFKRLTGYAHSVNHVQQMMDAAKIVGSSQWFIRLSHTPRPLLRSTMQQFYETHPDRLVQNIRNRFRSTEHFRTDELVYLLLQKEGRLHIIPEHNVLMEYMPHGGLKKLERKLYSVTSPDSHVCFVCFGSLDKADDTIYSRICDFAENILKEEKKA